MCQTMQTHIILNVIVMNILDGEYSDDIPGYFNPTLLIKIHPSTTYFLQQDACQARGGAPPSQPTINTIPPKYKRHIFVNNVIQHKN